MGIDHKLEGRKQKDPRTGKWKRQKGVPAPVKATINGKGKVQVMFDEQARSEWLTGFGKRKAERRKFGLAMQILKEKKMKKETLKQIRMADSNDNEQHVDYSYDDNNDNNNNNDNNDNDNNDNDNNNNDDDNHANDEEVNETLFDDEQTKGMFGGAVSVVVDTGVGDEIDTIYRDNYHDDDDDNNNNDDNDVDNDDIRSVGSYKSMNGSLGGKRGERESSLQRALKEVAKKNLLAKRKKFSSPNPFPRGKSHKLVDSNSSTKKKGKGMLKASGKTLIHKATGGQSFKGKGKGFMKRLKK